MIRSHLERVERANATELDVVAERMLDVIRRDGTIFVAGTGHSLALVLEGFYRAGGLACVAPIWHAGLLPLNGGPESTLLERVPGFAHLLVERANPQPGDVGVVFSNSGVNPVPVELASELRARGAVVVGVVSLTHLRAAPARAGRKLDEIAHHVLDTQVPYGDAAYPVAGGGTTAGLSSLTSVFLWNLLLARLADGAPAAGVRLPLWTSANVEGGDERNRELLARYRGRIPAL